MSILLRTTYIIESFSIFQLRPTIDISSIHFSFNIRLNQYKSKIKVESFIYIQWKQVLKTKTIDGSNMLMNNRENKVSRVLI